MVRPIVAKLLILTLAWSLLVSSLSTASATQSGNIAILRQAKQSYYNLPKNGFLEFKAKVEPNWSVAVKGIEQNPEAMRLLSGLKFSLMLNSKGEIKLNHEATIPAPNAAVDAGYKQIFEGMDQQVSGFFETWNLFMLSTPFPDENSEYTLEDSGNEYRINYKEQESAILIRMKKDLVVTEISTASSLFTSVVRPHFVKTSKGNILAGYSGSYLPATGPGKTELELQVEYLEVSGFQLPRKLRFSGFYDGKPIQSEMAFSEYQVNGKDLIKEHQGE